jgi:heme exporter protein C
MKPTAALPLAAILMVGIALFLVFVAVPTPTGVAEKIAEVFRIFYFHVPSAWVGFLAFFVVFVCSVLSLTGRGDQRRWDTIAACSAEIGVLFTTIVIITGPIWAKPAWGVYWTWEPKLTTALILWFIYVSYLMLRGVVDEEQRRARYSAVLGIVGFVDVPIVFFSVRLWGSIAHPVVVGAAGGEAGTVETYRMPVFFFCLVAFTVLYAALLAARVAVERDRQKLVDLTHRLQEG